MRLFCLFLVLLLPVSLLAQDSLKHKNEIGLMADLNMGSENNNLNMVGLQYIRWKNPHFAGRFSISIAGYSITQSETFLPSYYTDSIFSKQANYTLSMVHFSAGFQVQRHFYRKVYLYAGGDLSLGLGTGYYDTSFIRRGITSNGGVYEQVNYGNTTKRSGDLYVGVSPFLGVKINLKRWVIGTELSNAIHGVSRSNGVGNGKSFSMDFAAANFNQRLYINYRF
jgi:hypothetical protein